MRDFFRILAAIALFCAIPLTVMAVVIVVQGGGGGGTAPASCNTEVNSEVTGTTLLKIGDDSNLYVAGSYTASSGYCLCKVALSLKTFGSPSGSLSVELYDNNSIHPGNSLATATETKSIGDLTTSFAEYEFTFSSCSTLTTGSTYWIVTKATQTNNSTNYFATQRLATGANRVDRYGGSWITVDSSDDIYRRIYY